MKISQTGDLNNKNLFSHSTEGWEFTVKLSANLAYPEASPLDLEMATSPSPGEHHSSCCVLTWASFLCACLWCLLVCPSFLFLLGYQAGWISPTPTPWPYVTFISSLKTLCPNTVTSKVLGVSISRYKFWGSITESIIWSRVLIWSMCVSSWDMGGSGCSKMTSRLQECRAIDLED